MTEAKPVAIPIDTSIKFSKEEYLSTEEEREQMRNTSSRRLLVGRLVYLANVLRQDLSFAVSIRS